jgi:hypothetical protein
MLQAMCLIVLMLNVVFLFIYLCFRVLQSLIELNSRGGLDPRVSFSIFLSLPFLVLFPSEKGLLLRLVEWEELQSSTALIK